MTRIHESVNEAATQQRIESASWQALLVFAAYRLILAIILFFVFHYDLPPKFLGQTNADLYDSVTRFYIVLALLIVIATSQHWGDYRTQTRAQLVIDIIILTLIIHASGGLTTGLGALLVVVVVAGGALIPGRLAAFIAAIATLSVLIEASYAQISGDGVARYSNAGMLGATFFATALLAQLLSKKMQHTEVIAEQRAQDVAKLAVLNQHIISRMQIGVVVLDEHGYISLVNESARSLLGLEHAGAGQLLKRVVPELAEQIWSWKHHRAQPFEPFQARSDLPQVLAQVTQLDSGEILIYIENTSAIAQQAQQLKLASLGRLTASIAHEVRNPLGAISHAGELLAESNNGSSQIAKLTDIIQRHSARVNGIIETILQMSRRKTVEPSVIVLATWLENLILEFCEINHLAPEKIQLSIQSPLAKVWMDQEQLHQIVSNLLENAWHYADQTQSSAPVEVTLDTIDNEAIIEVRDNGPGISAKVREHLFEPFYSERQGGTGLGLYLARELCQANGARLNYLAEEQQCCFRINLPLQRQEIIQ